MSDAKFECPNCGKAYRWQSKIAGKKVRCACTQKFRVPMVPGETPEPDGPLVGQAESPTPAAPASPSAHAKPAPPQPKAPEPDPYELDLPDDEPHANTAPLSARSSSAAKPTGGDKCPSCNSPLRPGAVICLNCGFNVAAGAKLQTVVEAGPAGDDDAPPAGRGSGAAVVGVAAAVGEERVIARSKLQDELAADLAKRHHFQEKTLPLIFLGGGVLLLLVNAFLLMTPVNRLSYDMPDGITGNLVALISYLILFAVQLPCLFVGILIVSKLFGSAFGELFSAIKKLAALALLAGQFDVMVELGFNTLLDGFGFIAFWVELALSFGVFWALAKQLFDELEPGETVALWIAMLFLPGFVVGALMLLVIGFL
ncbi:MAG: hypothetical protein AAF086_02070 [Planctomycetota bacterium]